MQRNLGAVEQKNSAITLRLGVEDLLFQYSRSISITPTLAPFDSLSTCRQKVK